MKDDDEDVQMFERLVGNFLWFLSQQVPRLKWVHELYKATRV